MAFRSRSTLVPGEPGGPRWGNAGGEARRPIKTSEHIALEIVRDIVQSNLKSGDRLPLEAELVGHFRASRSSVREALRLLEVQGLIVIRPGSHSGTMVGEVRAENLGRTMTLYMHMEGTTFDEVLESWVITEPLIAEMAARNPDRAQVKDAMQRFVSEVPDNLEVSNDFHRAVRALVHNRALRLAVSALTSVVGSHILMHVHPAAPDPAIGDDHRQIAKAILAGDTAQARDLMAAHTRHVVDIFRAEWPSKVGERVRWS